MSTDLATRPQTEGKLADWIAKPEIHSRIAAAVGDIMDADQFIAHAMVAFQDPKVKGCTPLSQFTALHQLAALGLLPTLGQVALVPYKDIIKCSPQWQGYKALMERNASILEVQAVIVHKSDSFTLHNGVVEHNYDPFDEKREIKGTEDVKGGYCKIVYSDGRPPKYHLVTSKHIDKCRKCAQTQDVWNKWPEQMILKTLYRDCYARRAVPMDPLVHARLQQVTELDDLNLGNDPMRVESKVERIAASQTTTPEPDPIAEEYYEPVVEEQSEPEIQASDADLLNEYYDGLREKNTATAINEWRLHADQNSGLSSEGKAKVNLWCDELLADIKAHRGAKGGGKLFDATRRPRSVGE